MVTVSRFTVSNWKLTGASPNNVAAVADAGLIFSVDTQQHTPKPQSASSPSPSPQQYIPKNEQSLPDAVPALFLGSAFAVADPTWSGAILDAMVSRPSGTSDLLLQDGHERVCAFVRHRDALQAASALYGSKGASLSLGSLLTLSMAAAARALQATSTAGLVDRAHGAPLKVAALRVLGRWCPDALLSTLWTDDARSDALAWVMADTGRRTALASLMHTLAAAWVRQGGTPPKKKGALQGLSVRFSSPDMNDGCAATADSLAEEWAMLTGTRVRAVSPGAPGAHPEAAPGLLEHRVFAMPLQAALGALYTGTRVAVVLGEGADGALDDPQKKGGQQLRVTHLTEDAPSCGGDVGKPIPTPHIATPPHKAAPDWSPGWRVAADTLGVAPTPTNATPIPPPCTHALPVYRVPGLMVEQVLQGCRVEYVPLFLSPVEAKQAWAMLQPYCAQLVRAQHAAQRKKRLTGVLFSIARAAGAGPPAASGSLGAGDVAGPGDEDEGELEDPPEIGEFTRELGEGPDSLGGSALELGSNTSASTNPVSAVAAGALSTAAAAWHGAVEAVDHVLYSTPATRALLLPRLYPAATVQRSTYAAQVAAVAAHNARLCGGSDADADADAARGALQLVGALGAMPAPRFNPYKGMLPAEEEATCCRVPIAHAALPAPEGPPSLLVLVHPRLGEVPAMDWRLRVDMDALLDGSGYRHAALLSPKAAPGALARLQARLVVEDDDGDGVEQRGVHEGPSVPRGVLVVGDLGLHVRRAHTARGRGVVSELEGSRALVTVLGGRWWRRAPVLAAPPIPMGIGSVPVTHDHGGDYTSG